MGGRRTRQSRHEQNNDDSNTSALQAKAMPDRLRFEHNGKQVKVECMCVEVKSQNDRLDPRQEDWLNILDKFGNARVCKFEKQKVSKPPRKIAQKGMPQGHCR
jgi:hypothetical protein